MNKIFSSISSIAVSIVFLLIFPWPHDATSVCWSIALLAIGASLAIASITIIEEVKNRHGKD